MVCELKINWNFKKKFGRKRKMNGVLKIWALDFKFLLSVCLLVLYFKNCCFRLKKSFQSKFHKKIRKKYQKIGLRNFKKTTWKKFEMCDFKNSNFISFKRRRYFLFFDKHDQVFFFFFLFEKKKKNSSYRFFRLNAVTTRWKKINFLPGWPQTAVPVFQVEVAFFFWKKKGFPSSFEGQTRL